MTDAEAAPEPLIVGVGASAGGLDALESLLTNAPADIGMAFVVVQHLSPDFETVLDELLARRTELPVHRVENGVRVEAGHAYVIPPRNDMIIADGRLLLSDKGPDRELSLPIDIFFRSLARDVAERSVAVVLSGTGTDGSRGIRAVSDAGGLVIAQSLDDARFDGMPRAARETGCVDVLLPAGRISPALVRYRERFSREGGGDAELDDGPTDRIIDVLRAETNLDFEHYKPTTVARRLERRVLLRQDADLAEYADRIASDPQEVDALYRDLLIGVTHFFRDAAAFATLEHEVIPSMIDDLVDERDLRIWVAGCATGEEAYSLAMLVHEAFEERGRTPAVKIFATDVHRGSLDVASDGVFSEAALEAVDDTRRERWFTRAGDRFRVSSALRQSVVFAEHDVIRDAPFTRLDLITCRNLLIYLRPGTQQKVLSMLHFGLRAGGVLFLGGSETLGGLTDEFDEIDARQRIFRKRTDTRLSPARLNQPAPLGRGVPRRVTQSGTSVRRLLASYDTLLGRYMPPAILVSKDREVLHVFGGASRYMAMSDGRPSRDLLDVLGDELKLPLTGAIQRVRAQGEAVRFTSVPFGDELLRLRVEPVPSDDGPADLLVVFAPMEEHERPPPSDGRELALDELSREQVTALERELEHTKENLQATIEELESSNEELQATNEELVASNEELQSTNEELQSVNEELYTVNAELQKKIDELTQLTHDMDNLLAATDVGTVFVDSDLTIRKFTDRITELFDLVPEDVGRPLRTFSHTIEHESLLDEARRVLEGGEPHEKEVRDRSGRWHFLRILPYRAERGVEGVVITVVDLSALKRAERELFRARHLLDSLMETLPDDVYFADEGGRFVRINPTFAAHLGLESPEAARGERMADLVPGDEGRQWDETDARIRRDGHGLVNEPLELERGGEHRWVLTTRLPLRGEDGAIVGTFGVSRDITRQKRAEDDAREAVKRRDAFLAILSHELRNPLGAIMNASHMADDREQAARVIRRQANHMARLLDDLLDVSRVTQDKIELRVERHDLRRLARESVQLLEPRARAAQVELSLEVPDAPVEVDGDDARLKQIVINLVGNGIKYNRPGGHVWVEVTADDSEIILRVRDDGLGMAPEMLDRVFDMFVQGDGSLERSEGGMGLGLALVRDLVVKHDGRVEAHSDGPGEGSELVVRLPVATGEAPVPRDSVPPMATTDGSVVLVEDEPDNREMMLALLERRGFDVIEAFDGQRGIELILEHRPAAAVVDIGLPRMSGYEVARAVRDDLGDAVHLVALTGYGTESDRARALDAGFDAHLVKPVSVDDLVAVLGAPGDRSSE